MGWPESWDLGALGVRAQRIDSVEAGDLDLLRILALLAEGCQKVSLLPELDFSFVILEKG